MKNIAIPLFSLIVALLSGSCQSNDHNTTVAEALSSQVQTSQTLTLNVDWELIKLIRRMQKENPTWTAQRIQGELVKLGLDVSDNTVAKYMRKSKFDDSKRQRWLTFLRNQKRTNTLTGCLTLHTFKRTVGIYCAISSISSALSAWS